MKRILALILVLIMAFSLSACGNGEVSSGAPPADGSESTAPAAGGADDEPASGGMIDRLNIGTFDNNRGALLSNGQDSTAGSAQSLVFDMLIYIDPETGEPKSNILDFEIVNDGTSLSMTLKDGITFSNGAAATGEDLLYTFQSQVQGHARGMATVPTTYDPASARLLDDGMTVVVESAGGLHASHMFGELMLCEFLNKEWCESDENVWAGEIWYHGPVGSGPYRVKEYVTNQSYLLEYRDDWWQAGERTVPAKEIKITYYNDASTMYMDLENGAIDLAINIASADFARAQEDKSGKIVSKRIIDNNIWQLFMDVDNSPLSNQDLRLAIAHAVDWNAVALAGQEDLWSPATSFIASTMLYYKNVGQYEYDVELAKQYLAKAGCEPGELTLNMTVTMGPMDSMAVVIQYYLGQVGIGLNIKSVDPGSYIDALMSGDGDFQFMSMPQATPDGDPISMFKAPVMMPFLNVRRLSDEKWAELFEDFVMAKTDDEIASAAGALQQHIFDTASAIAICEINSAVAWNPEVIADPHLSYTPGANLNFIELAQ
ncbi:MAG: ABC transporter substrate-binding protein [Oscillospiraceae bacterium]